MTPETQIKNMINEGKLFNINDKVTMVIRDMQIDSKDTAVFQLIGYSTDLDAWVVSSYCANMEDARRFGNYLIELADKYAPQAVEVVETKTKKGKR